MKKISIVKAVVPLMLIVCVALGCKNLAGRGNNAAPNAPANANSSSISNQDNSTAKKADNPGVEKPDFTVTSEDLDKEYTRNGVTDKDLKKYENKIIRVSGRISLLVTEKKGTVQPWVTLFAPGVLHGVSCYFDDKDVDQMKALKDDGLATVQGLQDDFIVPTISPSLKHCAVIEAK